MDTIFYQPEDIAPLSLPALLPASTAPAAPIPEIGLADSPPLARKTQSRVCYGWR